MQLLAGLWRHLNSRMATETETPNEPDSNNRFGRLGMPQIAALFLEHLRGRISLRRQQLFACAVCRSNWDLVHNPSLNHVVLTCEKRADGLVEPDVPSKAVQEVLEQPSAPGSPAPMENVEVRAVVALARGEHLNSLLAAWQTPTPYHTPWLAIYHDLLEGIVSPIAVEPQWLTWNDGLIPQLARVIYHERRFEELLPVLADALEEAGCTVNALLEHCRSAGPHFPGCWAIDLLLQQD